MDDLRTLVERDMTRKRKRDVGWCLFFGLFVLWCAFLLGGIGIKEAHCSPLDCEAIRDHDQRNYCRGVTKQDVTYCDVIRDPTIRATCRAMVR